jgi:hypothetical protein
MVWNRTSRITFALLLVLAGIVAVVGLFMADIRDALIFKPRRALAETAVLQLAAREAAMRKIKGRFDLFTPGEAAVHLKTLGMSLQDWPSEDFVLDASLMPNKHLRLRALPRPEAVQDLRVGAQMFVAEVTATGGISQSGWYP